MARVNEATGGGRSAKPTLLNDALVAGLESLDLGALVEFTPYHRIVLPADGYVFWQPDAPVKFAGSLHVAEQISVEAEETADVGTVIFSSEKRIEDFQQASSSARLWTAWLDGLRYAFSAQTGFYSQAGLWHYTGRTIYPALASQLLDADSPLDLTRRVVSNSLPLWLSLQAYSDTYLGVLPGVDALTLYPAFEVAQNEPPPYGVVNITQTEALGAFPVYTPAVAHSQLAHDSVEIVFYGLQNREALQFQDALITYSRDFDALGIMNMPIIRDTQRAQDELRALGMRKTMQVEVSYYQDYAETVGRQLILSSVPTIYVQQE